MGSGRDRALVASMSGGIYHPPGCLCEGCERVRNRTFGLPPAPPAHPAPYYVPTPVEWCSCPIGTVCGNVACPRRLQITCSDGTANG